MSFAALGLTPALVKAIAALGFTHPTPIQSAAIGPALAGADVLGQAQTGSGKTAAFALPLLQWLVQQRPQAPRRTRAQRCHGTRRLGRRQRLPALHSRDRPGATPDRAGGD